MVNKLIRFFMIFVVMMGFFVLVLALTMLYSFENTEKWIVMVFIGIGVFLIGTGLFSVYKINRRLAKYQKQEQKLTEALDKKKGKEEASYATWQFTTHEWEEFSQKESKRKRNEVIFIGILIVIIGVPFLMIGREAPFMAALGVSVALAFVYGMLSFAMNKKRYAGKDGASCAVSFFKDSLLINGKLQILNDDKITLFAVSLSKIKEYPVIEFKIFWYSSKQKRIEDEIYIPVPDRFAKEASLLIETYKSGIDSKENPSDQ